MVRDFRVEAAAVDSTVLAGYLQEHEDHQEKFTSVESLGPLPIYPFLFNSRLSGMQFFFVVGIIVNSSIHSNLMVLEGR